MSVGRAQDFVNSRLAHYVGQNFDVVGPEIEDIAQRHGFWFRWLEPQDRKVAPEPGRLRVTVRVTRRHRIVNIAID